MAKQNTKERASRGRPALTQAQILEMRQRIAETARHLFRTEGFVAVSMRRLAKEVGCTPMTLYRYYPSKLEILYHLWSQVFDDLFTHVLQAAKRRRNPVDRLKAISLAYVDYWIAHPEHYRMVFATQGVADPEVSIFVDSTEIVERYALIIDAVAAATKADAESPALKFKSDFLICSLNGIAHNHIMIGAYPWSSPKTLVKMAIEGLL